MILSFKVVYPDLSQNLLLLFVLLVRAGGCRMVGKIFHPTKDMPEERPQEWRPGLPGQGVTSIIMRWPVLWCRSVGGAMGQKNPLPLEGSGVQA